MAYPSVCPHTSNLDPKTMLQLQENYSSLWRILSFQTSSDSIFSCSQCKAEIGHRRACLHCTFVSCVAIECSNHFKTSQHFLALDLSCGEVYCSICHDFVYMENFDETQVMAETRIVHPSICELVKRRLETQSMIWMGSHPGAFVEETVDSRNGAIAREIGIRGFHNLGNTCFMNAVLQTLLCNPIIRNYFLSDAHNHRECKRLRKLLDFSEKESWNAISFNSPICSGHLKGNEFTNPDVCVCCDIDQLLSEFYSDDISPLSPHSLLLSTWKSSPHLVGYKQQDAHEFLIATLQNIHKHTKRLNEIIPSPSAMSSPRPMHVSSGETSLQCNCITHTAFGGLIQSELVCSQCESSSITLDPFLDLQLHISKEGDHNGDINLTTLLDRYTSTEMLPESEMVHCDCCGRHSSMTKRMKLQHLPPVLCLQFKRFEQFGSNRYKIQKFIDFPLQGLNMAKYITQKDNINCAGKQRTKKRQKLSEAEPNNWLPKINHAHPQKVAKDSSGNVTVDLHMSCEYDLVGVVNHIGTLDTGHYTSFVRHQSLGWCLCDDRTIYQVSNDQIVTCNAYILFYVHKYLSYASTKCEDVQPVSRIPTNSTSIQLPYSCPNSKYDTHIDNSSIPTHINPNSNGLHVDVKKEDHVENDESDVLQHLTDLFASESLPGILSFS